MLHVLFGSLDTLRKHREFIYNPSLKFDILFREEGGGREQKWLEDDLVRRAITAIDRIELGPDTEYTLFTKGIYPEHLATGTKNLILCKFYNGMNRLSCMGPNCYPFLAEIASQREVTIGCSIVFDIREDFFAKTPVHILNYDKVIYTCEEWIGDKSWLELTHQ